MASSGLRNPKKQEEKAVDDDDRVSQFLDTLLDMILWKFLPHIFSIWILLEKFLISSEEDDIEEESCHDHHQDIRNLVLDYLEELSHATELIIGTWFAKLSRMTQLLKIVQNKVSDILMMSTTIVFLNIIFLPAVSDIANVKSEVGRN
ncbi:hypothetical protein HAX54_048267 [Datura stramonium]|uniref:Uncharacterized protein n=1 Tax=Datura stramonium TaxID=4076 RepID=A0ABS8WJ62_DATST|nr:hypothetical protein [Datura stramonium]